MGKKLKPLWGEGREAAPWRDAASTAGHPVMESVPVLAEASSESQDASYSPGGLLL